MAIIRKGQKADGQGLPSGLVQIVREAATFKATADFFTTLYQGADKDPVSKAESSKGRLEAYLDNPECPVTVTVGAGGGIKVPDIGSLSFSQPERVDNGEAIEAIIAALKDGTLQPDALSEVISTVNKDGLLKALPAASTLVKTSDKLIVTLRIKNEFREAIVADLEQQVATVVNPAPAAEVTLVQPETATAPKARRATKGSDAQVEA